MGIAGFGLMYNGLSSSMLGEILIGIPLALTALGWVGSDLARSNLAARRRRLQKTNQTGTGRVVSSSR